MINKILYCLKYILGLGFNIQKIKVDEHEEGYYINIKNKIYYLNIVFYTMRDKEHVDDLVYIFGKRFDRHYKREIKAIESIEKIDYIIKILKETNNEDF